MMEKMILDFPAQFAQGYKAGQEAGKEYVGVKIENIIICGMGGSALPGSVLEMSATEIGLQIPVRIHRNYGLPKEATNRDLVVVISYSGNTEEALSSYKEAREKEIPLVAITTGGPLQKMGEENNTSVVLIPDGLPPRLAIGAQYSALAAVLENSGVIGPQEKNFEELARTLDAKKHSQFAESLAENLKEFTPLIYSSQKYKNLAYILKIQLNETSKKHAFCNYFPELNHNEMVGFETDGNFAVLILRAEDDDPKIKRRMELTASILKEKGVGVEFLDIQGEKVYDRIFNTVIFGNWLSYYTAVKNGVDPIPVEIIEKFKNLL